MFANYPQYEFLFAEVQLVLFMLGLGATLSLRDFGVVVRQPQYFLVAMATNVCLIPLLAVLINRIGHMEPGIAVGLVLMAAMPGGAMSKLFTYFGRGNLALSISLTACGILGSIVTVPLLLRLLVWDYLQTAIPDFQMPVVWLVMDVAMFVLIPVLLGMLVRRFTTWHATFSRWCIRIGLVVMVAMIVGSLGSGHIRPWDYGWKAPIGIIIFCVLAMQTAMAPFRLLRWPPPNTLAVGIEATMRNVNLALLIKARLFLGLEKGADATADGVLFVILYYAAVALIAGTPLALRYRLVYGRTSQAPATPPTSPA